MQSLGSLWANIMNFACDRERFKLPFPWSFASKGEKYFLFFMFTKESRKP
jgi:hypothetical protein